MGPNPGTELTWPAAVVKVARAWRPLVGYEVLMSLVATAVLGPIAAALSYELIELTGEPVLGNSDLARFLLSPLGILTLVLGLSLSLLFLLMQYSGLILLIQGAIGAGTPTVWQVIQQLIAAAPRLFRLAIVLTVGAILTALPFLLLAGLAYWLLLSGTDINYYIYERPPRFWLAAAIGGVLALGVLACTFWFFIRFAFALPATVLQGQSWLSALRVSSHLTRGRGGRLLLVLVGWLLLEQVVIVVATAGLDQIDAAQTSALEGRFTLLVWSTVALLLFDAAVLQTIAAAFAVGRALLVAFEYERAWRKDAGSTGASYASQPVAPRLPDWRGRAVFVAMLVAGPALSLLYASVLAHEFVDHRPIAVTAHRAGSKAAPENSIAALRLSMAAGADFVEIDVQLTADGQVVLMHDRDLRRMTGDARDVSDVNLADLSQLRLRSADHPSAEPIPSLSAFLSACDDRIRLNIEMKETERRADLPRAVVDVVRQHNFVGWAGVSCFRLAPLREIRRDEPRLPIGMILSAVQGDVTRLGVNFLSLNWRLVRSDLVRRAHRRGMEVHAWTVNDERTALRLLDLGCDNLITSDPALMRQVVDWYTELGDTERILLRLRRWMRD